MALSLGVQSHLGEKAIIYYSHHFKARSVGRVSDLIAACLKEKNLDPLTLRGSILYALYIGYCISDESLDTTLKPPNFSLEVGFDETKIAVSLSVHLTDKQEAQLGGIKVSIDEKNFSGKIEKLLFDLGLFSETLEIRHFREEKTFELLFFLSTELKAEPSILWVEAPRSEKTLSPSASLIELGDIDYLKSLGIYIAGTPNAEEEIRISGTGDPAMESIKVKGKSEDNLEKINVSGNGESSLESIRISGKTGDIDNSTKTFKADGKNEENGYRISGGAGGKDGDNTAALNAKITDLQNKVANIEKERDSLKEKLATSKMKPKAEGAFGLLKSVWPFKKEEPKEPEAERIVVFKSTKEENQSQDETTTTIKGDGAKLNDEKRSISGKEEEEEEELKDSSSSLLFNKLRDFNPLKEGSAFKKVLVEMEKNGDAAKQSYWRETLKAEMSAEKARIHEIVKELGRQTRQRENEFLSKERTAAAELRKKEETIRQKETLIQQKSEQLAQANMNMERLKGSNSNAEEQGMKLKLSNAQKLLQMKEDENKLMLKKLKDLENKVMVAQSKSSGVNNDPQMLAKLASSEKRVEEFKRMNQRLTDSLQKAQEKRDGQENTESKRQLETVERQFAEAKKNLEKSSQKLKEAQDGERKLQVEVGKLQEENKKLKQTISRAATPGEDEAA